MLYATAMVKSQEWKKLMKAARQGCVVTGNGLVDLSKSETRWRVSATIYWGSGGCRAAPPDFLKRSKNGSTALSNAKT